MNADPDIVIERGAPLTERGRRTRDKLLAAARSLFEERGYAATRMSDVSIVAGVSHGTAYTWFTDKEAVLRALVDTIVSDAYRALAVGDEISDPMARMAEANRRYLEAYRRDGRMLEVVEEVAGTDPRYREVLSGIRRDHVARVTREIERLQRSGIAAADVDPAIAASLGSSSCPGQMPASSHSSAWGLRSFSTKSRTDFRNCSCSGVKITAAPLRVGVGRCPGSRSAARGRGPRSC